jgi:hypothetical protein
MASPCGGDPVVCIEFAIIFIGEFLKDWTTMAMLAVLLGLLFRLRADQRRAREEAYAGELAAYADRREAEGETQNWTIEGGEAGGR